MGGLSASDSEPNNTRDTADYGGILSRSNGFSSVSLIPYDVQSFSGSSFESTPAILGQGSDAADVIRFGVLQGLQSVKIDPRATAPVVNYYNQGGVAGVASRIVFAPSEGFVGNALTIEQRVGFSYFDAAGAKAYGDLGNLAVEMSGVYAAKLQSGIDDVTLRSDLTRVFDIIQRFTILQEQDGRDASGSSVSQGINQALASYTTGSGYLSQIKTLGAEVANWAGRFDTVHFLVNGTEVSEIQMSQGVTWQVNPTADTFFPAGFLTLTGYTALLKYDGPKISNTDISEPRYTIVAADLGLSSISVVAELVAVEDPLVDDAFYFARNPDVAAAGVDPDVHYRQSGWREGRDPNAFFSVSDYLDANRDVRDAGLEPLGHYLADGWREGRDPGPSFDTSFYLARHRDVAAAGVNPLAHYLADGREEGRPIANAVGPINAIGFDAQFYLFNNPDVARSAIDPYSHYAQNGWREGRDPNALFDSSAYRDAYRDVAAANIDPLAHYHANGWREGRDPSAAFDTSEYRKAYPDVAAQGANPLLHYLQFGYLEGRSTFADGVFG